MAVDPNIKKKADDIRNKIYGKEVRESLASGLEAVSSDVVENTDRQSEVEEQFQNVIENTTDKDVISAPEIISARNGKPNLKTRIDDLENETTAQLANIYYQAPLPNGIDDSEMVRDVLQHCVDNNYTALFLPGTYVIRPNVVIINLLEDQQLKMKGYGKKTIFKRMDMTTTENWMRIFDFKASTSTTGDVDLVQIEDIFMDSNARNQQKPPVDNEYEFQHSADFNIYGNTDSRIRNVIINNLYCDDGVADHLYFAGSSNNYIDSIRIDNMEVYSRQRVRSDITITGTAKHVYISNFNGQKLEVEVNQAGGEKGILTITDSVVHDDLDLGGQMRNIEVSIDNVKSMNRTHLWHTVGQITNSSLTFSETQRINYPMLTFNNCKFRILPDDTGKVHPIIIYTRSDGTEANFIDCSFEIVGEDSVETSSAIETIPIDSIYQDINVVRVENCQFDERFEHSIDLDRSGSAILKNNEYAGRTAAIQVRSEERRKLRLEIESGNYEKCEAFISVVGAVELDISLKNILQKETNGGVISSGSALGTFEPVNLNNRTIIVTADPTQQETLAGFKGDKYVLETPPDSGNAYEWVSSRTHHFRTNIKPLLVMP